MECIPRILHMIWIGCDPPEYFWANKRTWESLMPSWQVRCWHDTSGVEERVAERVHAAETGAQKADILRYALVYEHGGVYVDADVTPHRSLDPIVALGARVVLCHDMELTLGLHKHRVLRGGAARAAVRPRGGAQPRRGAQHARHPHAHGAEATGRVRGEHARGLRAAPYARVLPKHGGRRAGRRDEAWCERRRQVRDALLRAHVALIACAR